jgi:hypothetical protein
MGAIDIASLGQTGTAVLDTPAPVIPDAPASAPAPEIKTSETVAANLGNSSSPAAATSVAEKPAGTSPESFLTVGDKSFSREEVEKSLEKIGRFQSERDQAESTMERFVGKLRQSGWDIDRNLNLYQPQQQPATPSKQDLMTLAAAGDQDSLRQLMELQEQEVVNKVFSGLQGAERQKVVIDQVKKEYPDYYTADGQPNLESPIAKETMRLLDERPDLGSVENLPILAAAAQANLLKRNLGQMQQTAVNQAMTRTAQSAGSGVALGNTTPTATPQGGDLTPEQLAASQKLGVSSERLNKLVERVNQRGGYTIG